MVSLALISLKDPPTPKEIEELSKSRLDEQAEDNTSSEALLEESASPSNPSEIEQTVETDTPNQNSFIPGKNEK